MKQGVSYVWKGWLAICLLLACGALPGCVYLREDYAKIDYSRDYEGQKQSFKRTERHPERNFWHHWTRTAYRKPRRNDYCWPCDGYRDVVLEYGKPDFIRKRFASMEDQVIDEWLYLDEAKLFQFHRNQIVFEGPVTDYELTLLRRGYPDHALAVHTESAPNTDIFIYNSVFQPQIENFKFSDGYLIQSKEGE